ncbi:hypothetical protein TTHERM_00301730 (macronuclear) [Tetrahymena thermophila SB210]|uniref:Uncharacterized protein n=1 Tax=Tetrahymena thermophila (strain SB210) TaxID=312017 RepID=I7LXC3_TETTS|nr:hypothetical protein TTHERM_00301730 [Tetrahymena thermophila SB210]EAS04356.2 hypothetical protein TTHERM_00301730 [Tetrahymena thermophila SB210]|eukprot:XP_001024601.2 hypothetical protein TTHERM_00301730 [Tetrahymena thermophila SB210]
MRRQSSESSKEPKGILKTQTKYGIPTSPSSHNLSKQGQSRYESVLKQHGDSILKKEIEQKSLQQIQITNENKNNNNSFHNKSNASINSARQNNNSKLDNQNTSKRQSISQQQIGQLNQSVDKQRRQSRLNDQILENSQGSRLAAYSQSPLNINQSHIINNSIHAYVNNQNQLSHSPHQYQTSLAAQVGNIGGTNTAAATLNSIFNQVTLKDLCPEDKRKIGQLMKKLAEEKQEKELLKQKLQLNENVYKERINHIVKENQQIQENTNVLKERFQQSVKLLQNIRDRSAERSSPNLYPQQTPQSNNQFNYDSNQSSQPPSQQQKKQLNKSLQQISDNNIGAQEQLQNNYSQNQLNKSNQELKISSFQNIPVKDLPEDQQQMRQSRQSDFQIGSSLDVNNGNKQEDIDENEDRLSRHSRISKQGEIQNSQGFQQNQYQIANQQQINQPFASKQSTINANMYQKKNNNSQSSKNLYQFQQPPYLADSLDQEVQEFLSQSINNMQNGKLAELEQQLNQVSSIPQNLKNNQTPLNYHQQFGGQIQQSVHNQPQQNFQQQSSPFNPKNQYQDQAAQTSFAKYVYKNGQVNDQQYILNNQLLKNNSQLKYSLSLQSKSPQTTQKKQPHLSNVYQSASFMQSNGTNNHASMNNHADRQQERVTLKINSGESEKMFNQWKKQYAVTSTNETIMNSPYKNQPFLERAKQAEEDDTHTFQEIQNLRSQMQGLVNSLKQISLNKQQKQEQVKQISQHSQTGQYSNKKQSSKESPSSDRQAAQKLLQGEIHSISSRGNLESLNSNKHTEQPKNTVKSTINSYKENRIKYSNTSQETFAQIPQHTQNHSSNRSSQKQDTIQTNPPPKYLKQYNSSNENSSEEDDDQIEIAQKFLNLKKQKLLSHLQEIRKDDFLDSSSFEQSQLFDKKRNFNYDQKHYDLPLQILQSETTSNANISTSYNNEKMSKFHNKYLQYVNIKDSKYTPSNVQQGERNYISPPSHQQNLGNYQTNQHQAIYSSRKSSPQMHLRPEVGNIDSNRNTSNPETLTRVTSRNIVSSNKNNGAIYSSRGELSNNLPLNLESMSKEEIKKLNRMLEKKLREMSESVSYEISSQNNELDVSEQINTNQIIAHNYINTPLRQSQNTNTFELSNTQIQIQSLQESQLLKYSNATGHGGKIKGNNNLQQKSNAQINNHLNPQNHNIHNISGVTSNNQTSQRSTHKNITQQKEQTNPTLNDEYVTFRHEENERGDTKRTVEYSKDKKKQNNLFSQNGLDESKRIDAVRVTENFSYLSTPQPEKLQVDLASTTKKDILQGHFQVMSSDEKCKGEDSKYIRVEDGKSEISINQKSAKSLILQKIQHLSDEEMLQVLQALKKKKQNKKSLRNQNVINNDSQDEYEQIKVHQLKQATKSKVSVEREEGDDENYVDEENEQSSYMSVQQQQEDIYQDNYEDIYNDISREQRFQQQDNDSQNLKRPIGQKMGKQSEANSKYNSKQIDKKQSDQLNEDVIEFNQLIQQSDHQNLQQGQSQRSSQKHLVSNTPQDLNMQHQNRLTKQNKVSQKSIKSELSREDDQEEEQVYDESLFQNVQTIEKQELSKRTLSAKGQKDMQLPQEDKKKNQFIEPKLDSINQQNFHISMQYQKIAPQNQEKKKQRNQLYQTEGMFEGEEEIPRREMETKIRKNDDKYYISSYTETDQSIKYIKKKIENQI